ncbi:MAG: methylmalonyl-CoA mutase family protein [Spirochaetota bacterium]|nr:methylmalonyl-CoA mutase family protein [Spirochaetota bacterium]
MKINKDELIYSMNKDSDNRYKTSWGSEIKCVYTSSDVCIKNDADYGLPGEYPFRRGVYPDMYRRRLWTKRFLTGHQSVEEFNKRQKALIASGSNGISFVPCSNTYMRGYDSDKMDREIVGVTGTPVDTLQDAEIAFDGIPLEKVSSALNTPNPHVLIAMYFVLSQKQGLSLNLLQGTSNQADIISHWLSCQQMIRFPLDAHLRCMIDHIKFCHKHVPKWHPLSIIGQHMSEAGASAVQEIAFSFSSAKFYIKELINAGLELDEFAPRLSFFFNVRSNFFEEIAKFRASRIIWARIMKEEFKSKNPKSWLMKFHAQTTGVELAAREAENNIVRSAYHSLSAVLGGVQSLHTDSFDEALWTPTPEAQRLAIMTQNILGEETGISAVADPLGGSYFIESLTNDIEEKICEEIEIIDNMGGMFEAVNTGYIQKKIMDSAVARQRAFESGERILAGVNKYELEKEKQKYPPQIKVDTKQIDRQIERTIRIREERNQDEAKRALSSLRKMAETGEGNIFIGIMDAVSVSVTQGEIISELREVYGFGRPDIFY